MKREKLHVGVIGLGLGRHFVAACDSSSHVERLVICDPDEQRRTQILEQFPSIAAEHDDIDAMLSAERLDLSCVVTP